MTPALDKLVVMGTSAGGLDALKRVLGRLPADFPAPVLVVMHIGARDSILPELLGKVCALPVRHARDGERLARAVVLVAPPDRHLMVARDGAIGCVRLSRGAMENYTRPAIDPLFRSAAAAYGPGVTGVVLTGYLDDGTAGLLAIKACGGRAVVQDPDEAFAPGMPASALEQVAVDHVLTLDELGDMLPELAAAPLPPPDKEAAMTPDPPEVPEWIQVENRYASGAGSMEELARIGSPSTFTCPECGGALWELGVQAGVAQRSRYRCHTGHSFTSAVLARAQDKAVEEAMWAAVRALNEQQALAQRLAAQARVGDGNSSGARAGASVGSEMDGSDGEERACLERAARARDAAAVLRKLLLSDEP